jgi:hypothetical protein
MLVHRDRRMLVQSQWRGGRLQEPGVWRVEYVAASVRSAAADARRNRAHRVGRRRHASQGETTQAIRRRRGLPVRRTPHAHLPGSCCRRRFRPAIVATCDRRRCANCSLPIVRKGATNVLHSVIRRQRDGPGEPLPRGTGRSLTGNDDSSLPKIELRTDSRNA